MPFRNGELNTLANYNRLKPWTRSVVDALLVQPAPRKMLVARAAALVPPGRAYRRATHGRRGSIDALGRDHAIAVGAADIVNDSVMEMVRGGTFARVMVDGVEYIEITDLGRRRLLVEEGPPVMDEKPNDIMKMIDEWTRLVRRWLKHDTECAIWNEKLGVCDCGLDAALRKGATRG